MDAPALTRRNRQRLREVVKRVHLQHYPTEHVTDREADRVIATLAPEAAERAIKLLVDGKIADGLSVEDMTFRGNLEKL